MEVDFNRLVTEKLRGNWQGNRVLESLVFHYPGPGEFYWRVCEILQWAFDGRDKQLGPSPS